MNAYRHTFSNKLTTFAQFQVYLRTPWNLSKDPQLHVPQVKNHWPNLFWSAKFLLAIAKGNHL